jgi:hypothetical protein
MISVAEAPSEICEALPAWITPCSSNEGLSLARVSGVVPRRSPSSAVNPGDRSELAREGAGVDRGGGELVAARGVLVEAPAGEAPLRGDPLGADALVEVLTGELAAGQVRRVALADQRAVGAAEVPAGAQRHPGHGLDPTGDDDVVLPGHHHPGREVERRLARSAGPVERDAGDGLRPARGEDGVAADLRGLVSDLVHAAPQDVVDEVRVDARALLQRAQHVRGQVDGVHLGQRTLPLADGGADRVDDDGLGHGDSSGGSGRT